MDKKGITWVGNVYKRFEDLCLDVEEDTVKYVENQFQYVGESVRRFYSNVMEDFLPLESEKNPNATKTKDDNEHLTGQDSVKKPNAFYENERITRTIEDMSVASPLIHVRRDIDNSCRPSGGKHARSGLQSRKCRRQVNDNNNNNNNNNNCLDSGIDEKSLCEDLRKKSFEFVSETRESSLDQMAKITTASVDEDCSKLKLVTESPEQDENLIESTAEIQEPSQDQTDKITVESSNEMVSNNEKEIGVQSSNDEVFLNDKVSPIGELSQNEHTRFDNDQPTKFGCNLATDIKPGTEPSEDISVQQNERSKLEDTIVLVNNDDIQALPHIECKKSTDKKKIRGLHFSRMRSGRKQEYRQLTLHHGDGENLDKKSDVLKKLPSCDSSESEWEIL